jgi:hypothetical protein
MIGLGLAILVPTLLIALLLVRRAGGAEPERASASVQQTRQAGVPLA